MTRHRVPACILPLLKLSLAISAGTYNFASTADRCQLAQRPRKAFDLPSKPHSAAMRLPVILWALAAHLLAGEPAKAGDPTGLWRSESGLSRYRVRQCGQGICVKIDWIVEGSEVRDMHNPDPAKRNRRVMGIDIISSSKRAEKDRWEGEIYNFKNGKTYIGRAELVSHDQLFVAGCILGGLICITQKMTRIH